MDCTKRHFTQLHEAKQTGPMISSQLHQTNIYGGGGYKKAQNKEIYSGGRTPWDLDVFLTLDFLDLKVKVEKYKLTFYHLHKNQATT